MIENLPVKVDDVGRIVIPKKIRKKFNIDPNDYLLLTTTNHEIIMKKENTDLKYKNLLEKLKYINKTFNFDIIMINNRTISYTTENYSYLRKLKTTKELKEKVLKKNIIFAKNTNLTKGINLQKSHCYGTIYIENYSNIIVFIIFYDDKNKDLAKTTLKLLQ